MPKTAAGTASTHTHTHCSGKDAAVASAASYRILAAIGKGSFGQVSRAARVGGEMVAVKAFLAGKEGNVEAAEAGQRNLGTRVYLRTYGGTYQRPYVRTYERTFAAVWAYVVYSFWCLGLLALRPDFARKPPSPIWSATRASFGCSTCSIRRSGSILYTNLRRTIFAPSSRPRPGSWGVTNLASRGFMS